LYIAPYVASESEAQSTLMCLSLTTSQASALYKKLSYRRGTARRAMLVEILSTAAQLYENYFRKYLKGHTMLSTLPLYSDKCCKTL